MKKGIDCIKGLREAVEKLDSLEGNDWLLVFRNKEKEYIYTAQKPLKYYQLIILPTGTEYLCLSKGVKWKDLKIFYVLNMFKTTDCWTWVGKNGELTDEEINNMYDFAEMILRQHQNRDESDAE